LVFKAGAQIKATDIINAYNADANLGFCTACGIEVGGVEPDAKGLRCEACGKPAVRGVQDLVFQLPPEVFDKIGDRR